MAPQTFHVLLCVNCTTFQVHIVKTSSNKWQCKLCETKQSLQQVYGKGSGAECREIVKKLNEARIKKQEEETIAKALYQHQLDKDKENESAAAEEQGNSQSQSETQPAKRKSKWSVFLDEEDNSSGGGGNYLY